MRIIIKFAKRSRIFPGVSGYCDCLVGRNRYFPGQPPCVTAIATRECIGIVTKIDHPLANPRQAEEWLRLAGCEKIFFVSSYTGEGVDNILNYLKEPEDAIPGKDAGRLKNFPV